jgi:hypothetical protein
MAAGRADGWTQRWSGGVPTWPKTSPGGFDRRRYVVELAEAPARSYLQANPYTAVWPPAVHLELAGTEVGHETGGGLLVGVLELSRVCLSPSVVRNAESFAVAAALRLAAGHGERGVVTYADTVARLRTLADGCTAGSPQGHLRVIYQALSTMYTGRNSAQTVAVPPDGQVLPARSIAKFVAGDRCADGFERRLLALGAPERTAGADRRAWLRTALKGIAARRSRHPEAHRFCGRFSRVAAWSMTVSG